MKIVFFELLQITLFIYRMKRFVKLEAKNNGELCKYV